MILILVLFMFDTVEKVSRFLLCVKLHSVSDQESVLITRSCVFFMHSLLDLSIYICTQVNDISIMNMMRNIFRTVGDSIFIVRMFS